MKLIINGETKLLDPKPNPPNLYEVIKQLGHHPRLIVVEFNGLIITREKWEQQNVKDGDTLEIVTIVGGGS